jgi:hypothetical protein
MACIRDYGSSQYLVAGHEREPSPALSCHPVILSEAKDPSSTVTPAGQWNREEWMKFHEETPLNAAKSHLIPQVLDSSPDSSGSE